MGKATFFIKVANEKSGLVRSVFVFQEFIDKINLSFPRHFRGFINGHMAIGMDDGRFLDFKQT